MGLACAWLAAAFAAAPPPRPHILLVVVDDFGWGNVGYHRATSPTPEVRTPTIDGLVKDGIELDRHYVHMTCTPSRSALQSGRLPVHVITQLANPCDANGAIPRNMTGLAAQLRRGGYATHHVGKWDAGMATPTHTPHGRGYDTSLAYFGHGNWAYTSIEWGGSRNHEAAIPDRGGLIDLWDTDRPAANLNGTLGHEEYLFRARWLDILHAHNTSTPLFLQYDSKLCHYPLQAPLAYEKQFAFITDDDNRRVYHAMVAFLDDQLANITGTMRALGMWEHTLMILSSDNGGFVKAPRGGCNASGTSGPAGSDAGHGLACFNGEAGANNWPLRGGKYSNFEGGIRVNAFVSGGFLPANVRGTVLTGGSAIVHIADWYATLCGLAGVEPFDPLAAASGLPPIDSLDMWPLISGANLTSPRSSFLSTRDLFVSGEWKYVRAGTKMIEAAHGGPHYPNASTAADPIDAHEFTCPSTGCLYNVVSDPAERHEVSADHPQLVASLAAQMDAAATTIWSVAHKDDPACVPTARGRWGGFLGPFRELA